MLAYPNILLTYSNLSCTVSYLLSLSNLRQKYSFYIPVIYRYSILLLASEFRPHWVKHNERVAKKSSEAKSKEFKNKQQIVKERIRKEKIKQKLKFKMNKKKKKKK